MRNTFLARNKMSVGSRITMQTMPSIPTLITRPLSSVAFASSVGLSILLAGCASSEKPSHSASLNEVPAAVRERIQSVVAGGKVEEISRESEDGVTVYEVEYEVSGTDRAATILEDGTLVEEETELTEAQLPAPVRHAVSKAATDWKIGEVSQVNAKGQTFYEVDVRSGGAKQELKVAADGTILSKSGEDDDDEHEGEDRT